MFRNRGQLLMPAGMPGYGGGGVIIVTPSVVQIPTPPRIYGPPPLVGWSRQRDSSLYTQTRAVVPARGLSYSTTFSATENPLSESGNWSSVFQRSDFLTTGGYAVSKQTGTNPPLGVYDDAIMCLSWGTWTDTEIVLVIGKTGSVANFCEIEAILRCNAATGVYIEINLAHDGGYCNGYLARGANTPVTNFDPLATETGGIQFSVAGGVHDGDLFRVRIVGSTITAEINYNDSNGWHLIATWTTGGFSIGGFAIPTSGRPGIGAFISDDTTAGPSSNYKIDSFTATAI
jgi:hypothetical protein